MAGKANRYVTLMMVPDGTEARLAWRVRQWVVYGIVGVVSFLLLSIILFFMFYGEILERAAMADRLAEENQALLRYRYKVQLLEENIDEARQFVERMAKLAGVDFEFPQLPQDSVLFAELENDRPAILSRPWSNDLAFPSGLPIRGFVTQDFEIVDSVHFHPGVDIACAIGSPVLATGAGLVDSVFVDSIYGKTLIIRHNDSITTWYGHNDSLLVEVGQQVLAGTRIALSGNTGRSSAPHMHYEVRVNNRSINPLESGYDEQKER